MYHAIFMQLGIGDNATPLWSFPSGFLRRLHIMALVERADDVLDLAATQICYNLENRDMTYTEYLMG